MWNAISTPILFIVPSELHKGNYFIALGLLFPLIGLSLIYSAVIKFMRWRKFKGARLELTTIPGYLGEKFSGKIHPGTAIEYNAHTEVILVCNKRTTSGKRNDGSPKSRASSQKQKIWEGKTRSSAIREIGGTAISFEIEIPPDKRPTTFDDTYPQISWTIIVTTALPGVDLYLEFDIPVTSRE
jgi:hypothetical protein